MNKQKNAAAHQYPDFFKLFFPKQSSEMMRIPNAFLKHLRGIVPKKAILESPKGRIWHVNICNIDGDMYFNNGWKKFTLDNSLSVGDFITFSFDGKNIFKFKIFKPTGCEMMETYNEEEDHEEKDSVMKEAEQEEQEEEEDENDEEFEEEEEEEYDDDEYTEMEEEKDEQVNSGSRKTKCSSLNVSHRGSSSRAKQIRIEYYGINAELYVQLDNPHFITKLGGNRNNELSIPTRIIRDFCLRIPERITLRRCCKRLPKHEVQEQHHHLNQTVRLPEEQGGKQRQLKSTWEGKVTKQKDGRTCINGWGAFWRSNGITENDICLCEFLLEEDQKIKTLQIHIIGIEPKIRQVTNVVNN